ncbi:MAG TPA: hypothetical protein VME68_03090, partial [Acidobacteriaceae bacterium]|nr:hypothetical protein [Acidobacteriaceae bacterium]
MQSAISAIGELFSKYPDVLGQIREDSRRRVTGENSSRAGPAETASSLRVSLASIYQQLGLDAFADATPFQEAVATSSWPSLPTVDLRLR